MTSVLNGLVERVVILVATGAILVSVSEFWFYEVGEEVDSILILLAYGLLGMLFLIVVQRFHVRSVAGVSVAAALLGFLIEGVPVPVVYSNPPLTIVWTSLAWHGLITVGLAWFAIRRALAGRSQLKALGLNAGLGVFLGAWNAYMWNAREGEGSGELLFDWQPVGDFAGQFLFGYALYLGGHILFDRAYSRRIQFTRLEHLGLWALAAAASLAVALGSGLLVLYPVLVILVAVCLLALHRASRARSAPGPTFLDRIHPAPLPLRRFAATLLIPLCALATYAGLVGAEIGVEMNVVVILTAGPVASMMFIWAIVALLRTRQVTPDPSIR